MNNDMMYHSMYNESLTKIKIKNDEVERLKIEVDVLKTQLELYRMTMRKELLRLQIELGQRNEKEQVVN